jgi:broad-specificity NMP kinase
MSTLRIAVTGVDGVGKTTLIRRLNEMYQDRPDLAFAIRSPQYHEDPRLPFGTLSAAIDELSILADRVQHVGLKCTALFLSMTLAGEVERHVISAYSPRVLVVERQCYLDTLAYAKFYLPLLMKSSGVSSANFPLVRDLGFQPEKIRIITSWLRVLEKRNPQVTFHPGTFVVNQPESFGGQPQAVLEQLKKMFRAECPDHIVILSASESSLLSRLVSKRSETPVPELHEKAGALCHLQDAMKQVAGFLAQVQPGLKVQVLDVENLTIEQTLSQVSLLTQMNEKLTNDSVGYVRPAQPSHSSI